MFCDNQTMFLQYFESRVGFAPLVDITNRGKPPPPCSMFSKYCNNIVYDEQNMPLFFGDIACKSKTRIDASEVDLLTNALLWAISDFVVLSTNYQLLTSWNFRSLIINTNNHEPSLVPSWTPKGNNPIRKSSRVIV